MKIKLRYNLSCVSTKYMCSYMFSNTYNICALICFKYFKTRVFLTITLTKKDYHCYPALLVRFIFNKAHCQSAVVFPLLVIIVRFTLLSIYHVLFVLIYEFLCNFMAAVFLVYLVLWMFLVLNCRWNLGAIEY